MRINSKLCNSDYIKISKLFSSANFYKLAVCDEAAILNIVNTFKEFCNQYEYFTLQNAYNEFYKVLVKNYKNEYVFKNIIFKDIILKNHKINDCVTIPEFNVGCSKADLAVFNGASTVYEIKSEIDTTERLSSQINDYQSFFEFIYVVTSEKHLSKVRKIVPDSTGIVLLNNSNKLESYRNAETNFENITHKSLFYSLRKSEYLALIADFFGFMPIMPNTKIFNYCMDLFFEIPIDEAYRKTLYYLKKRKLKNEHVNLIKDLPPSLKSMTIQHTYNKNKCDNIIVNIQKVFV